MVEPKVEIAEVLYKKLKQYENPKNPLFPTSIHVAGGCANLQEMLDVLDDLPKKSRAELRIERPDYSQFTNLKNRASSTFKRRSAEFLLLWGIEFEYKVSVSRNFYEALMNYVEAHGFVDPPRRIMQSSPKKEVRREGWTL